MTLRSDGASFVLLPTNLAPHLRILLAWCKAAITQHVTSMRLANRLPAIYPDATAALCCYSPVTIDIPDSSATRKFIVAILGTPTAPVSAITSPLTNCYATMDNGATKVLPTASSVSDRLKYNAAASTATSCTTCAGTVATDGLPDLLLTFGAQALGKPLVGKVKDNTCSATNAMVMVVCGSLSGSFYVKTYA